MPEHVVRVTLTLHIKQKIERKTWGEAIGIGLAVACALTEEEHEPVGTPDAVMLGNCDRCMMESSTGEKRQSCGI